jgi:hypothetical protein
MRDELIEKMHIKKNKRIARQTALNSAIAIVSISEQCRLEHPEHLGRRVLSLADEFYKWLEDNSQGG